MLEALKKLALLDTLLWVCLLGHSLRHTVSVADGAAVECYASLVLVHVTTPTRKKVVVSCACSPA
jgi:hypothetical protein